ncbi:MAG: four helix bundle protein [Candidatus Promineifilaceae bacterium]
MSEERVSLLEMLRERTKQYALRIIRLYGALPATTEAGVMGRQLLRSGTSLGANYREAYRARSNNEYVAKLGLCLQELDESAYWLELLADAGIFPPDKLAPLQDETNQLIALLTTIVKKKGMKSEV